MKVVLGYKYSKYIDLSNRINANAMLSPFDYMHIILDNLIAQPKILVNMNIGEGEWILQKPCEKPIVIAKDRVICDAEAGFSDIYFGVAVKKNIGGYLITSQKFSWSCNEAKYVSIPGAFTATCFNGKHANVVITSYNGLLYAESVYKRKPVSISIGYKAVSIIFDDGKSVIISYPNKIIELGMPIEVLCLTPREEALALSKNTIVEVSSEETRPLVVVNEKPIFKGFLYALPLFQLGSTLYVLDGGSLVKLLDVYGNVTAWNIIVNDTPMELAVYNPSLKLDMLIKKESNTKCWATSEGVVCCRGSWCGVVEPGETVIEIEPLNEVHGIAIKTYAYVKIHSDLGVQVVKEFAKIIDEKASLLRPRRYTLAIEHLLGFTDITLESFAKPVKVNIGKVVVHTSPTVHECGSLAFSEIEVKSIEKPSRVIVKIGNNEVRSTSNIRLCLDVVRTIPIVAVDPIANDSLKLFEIKPEISHISTPKVFVKIKHFRNYSEVEIVKDNDVEVVESKLCCYNACSDVPKRIEYCKLPAYIELKAKKNGFIYSYRFDIIIPRLLNRVIASIANSKTKIVRINIGGFIINEVLPEQPAVPPISNITAYIYPRNIVMELTSKTIGRCLVILPSGYIKGFILKQGKNPIKIPFADKVYFIIQSNLKWVYVVELKLEQMILAAREHAKALLKVLEKLLIS
jgi:hypothetical protein